MPPEKAVPLKPDPCLVVLRASELRKLTELDWREARRCPHGCGATCKGLR
ncbi:MAG: hypothetical protein ACJ79H_03560 [Myxococcales bacterium]